MANRYGLIIAVDSYIHVDRTLYEAKLKDFLHEVISVNLDVAIAILIGYFIPNSLFPILPNANYIFRNKLRSTDAIA